MVSSSDESSIHFEMLGGDFDSCLRWTFVCQKLLPLHSSREIAGIHGGAKKRGEFKCGPKESDKSKIKPLIQADFHVRQKILMLFTGIIFQSSS